MNLVRAGVYQWTNGNLDEKGNAGDYWSGTAGSNLFAMDSLTGYWSSEITFSPNDASRKGYGFSVRCIAVSSPIKDNRIALFFNQPKCNSRECTIELCEGRTLPLV